jgi:hypothetical protein
MELYIKLLLVLVTLMSLNHLLGGKKGPPSAPVSSKSSPGCKDCNCIDSCASVLSHIRDNRTTCPFYNPYGFYRHLDRKGWRTRMAHSYESPSGGHQTSQWSCNL